VPNYVAHAAGWMPNDRWGGRPWWAIQWNFLGPPGFGVDAPTAWSHLRAVRRPGGRGVVVAVLDSGVAYRTFGRYRRSPDFRHTRFVAPYDFVDHDRRPLDDFGHGTFMAGAIAESTNNGTGLTGLAYGASIMPVRVLDREGKGNAAVIARAIRYAARHGAKVINLSIEFDWDVDAREIPDVLAAIAYANARGALVVAAAGNQSDRTLAYPARARQALAVGATTADGCLADYSNTGRGLDLVAPGGGWDAILASDPRCGSGVEGADVSQISFSPCAAGVVGRCGPRAFRLISLEGTSVACPQASAAAALVIASGVLGRNPRPAQIERRLKQTARDLGPPGPDPAYGAGLLDAGAATAPRQWGK
jgi:serine protease